MFVRHARLPPNLQKEQPFQTTRLWCPICESRAKAMQKVAVHSHAHPSPRWCEAGWEDYCYCIFTEFNISILKSGPRNFLGLNHDAPQRVPFCRTPFLYETLEQNFKYQLWVQSSIRFEMVWMFTGQNIKFPTCDRFRTKPRHCVFGLQDRPK